MNIKPHLPIYYTPPNKLIRYEVRPFEVINGMDAQVLWKSLD